jgi:hypothetical protein
MTKKELDKIKEFFDIIFSEDVIINETDAGISIDFEKPVAKRDAVLNMARIKKVLNLYLLYNGITDNTGFRINVVGNERHYNEGNNNTREI